MNNCKHDQRFHLMNATNGCCACHCEQLAKQLATTKQHSLDLDTKLKLTLNLIDLLETTEIRTKICEALQLVQLIHNTVECENTNRENNNQN